MNYLTMLKAASEMAGGEMTDCNVEEPQPGSSYRNSNIYSVPLFYNDFYETAEQTVVDTHQAMQGNDHHICDETEQMGVPEVCGRSRYTSSIWKRQYVNSDVAREVSLRDSGTESLTRTSDVTQATHSTEIEVSPVYVNEIPEKSKVTNRMCSNYFSALLLGFVGGITLCSVVWLTVDKLKSDNLNCIVQTLQSSRDESDNATTEIPSSDRFPVNTSQLTVSLNNRMTTRFPGSDDGPSLSTSRTVIASVSTTLTSETQFSVSDTTITPSSTHRGMNVSNNDTKSASTSIETAVPSASSLNTEPTVLSSTLGTEGKTTLTEDNVAQNNVTLNGVTTTSKSSEATPTISSALSTPSVVISVQQERSTVSSTERFTDVTSDNNEPVFAGLSTESPPDLAEGGYVYVRWGRQECPNDNVLLYSGFIAGGHFIHSGGATNNLCLPSHPTWSSYDDRIEPDRNLLHVTEYQSSNSAFNTIIGKPLQDQNVPCAVCQARGRLSYVMIPGRAQCLNGWQQEYTGYLMGGSFEHRHGKSLICVDKDPQTVPGGSTNEDGNLLYFVEFRGTKTENYVNGRELACAVCTK